VNPTMEGPQPSRDPDVRERSQCCEKDDAVNELFRGVVREMGGEEQKQESDLRPQVSYGAARSPHSTMLMAQT
jgi:hypothetical protein